MFRRSDGFDSFVVDRCIVLIEKLACRTSSSRDASRMLREFRCVDVVRVDGCDGRDDLCWEMMPIHKRRVLRLIPLTRLRLLEELRLMDRRPLIDGREAR